MSNELQWPALLSSQRVGQKSSPKSPTNHAERSEFESDYDRAVFSEPFRRLAKKTQVHPLAPNDHIHNRLIHSIEVGSVGRSLGKKVQHFLQEKYPDDDKTFDELSLIVQVGCLIHDIGNPPFGHAGEYAIREWLAKHEQLVFYHDDNTLRCDAQTREDLLLFEGNAQGFRLAARRDNPKCGYMRLTYASLGSMIKYPWTSDDERAQDKKKFNVFDSEKTLFTKMSHVMGLIRDDGTVARHPLSFLTEAADDICYRMLDMEDAVLMGILEEKPIKDLFLQFANESKNTSPREITIAEARGRAINSLINESLEIFKNDYVNIMAGERERDLKADFSKDYKARFKEINEHYTKIFSHRGKLGYEIGSYKIIGRIIKAFVLSIQSLCEKDAYKELEYISSRCFDLAWGEDFTRKNFDQDYDWWLRQTFDFISGLTDNYAIQISREIEGVLTP